MRARRRNRPSNERGSQKAAPKQQRSKPKSNPQQRSGPRKGGNTKPQRSANQEAAAFWGRVADLPEPITDLRLTHDPAAVPRSLGTPPLPGQEHIAGHYFTAVYERAVQTAGALAAAGGLVDPAALLDPQDDD